MKLALMLGYWMGGPSDPIDMVLEAERLGYDSIWTAEAYGSDAISPLCWMGARTSRIKLGTSVIQLSARTPACAAMTAMTIDHLSGGRLILGIGVSGPQVVEGWYGQPFPRPMGRTREWISLFRQMIAREGPVSFQGQHYQLPYPGGTGLGKPLKLITKPLRDRIPIYLGAEGPKNIAMSVELCEGWIPLYYTPYRPEVYAAPLEGRRPDFEIVSPVTVSLGDDVKEALLPIKWMLAFYIGGMGAKEKNFHFNLVQRMGYGDAAVEIQELFFAGKRAEAAAAVPDEFADEISLAGPADRIRERLQVWKKSPVTTLLVGAVNPDPRMLKILADANAA